jgi:hypothetical protein
MELYNDLQFLMMKDLIKRILNEQAKDNIYDMISNEMDSFVHKKISRYPHSFFMVDENNVIVLELDKNGYLWVNGNLIKRLSKKLLISSEDSKRILKKWIIKNYK